MTTPAIDEAIDRFLTSQSKVLYKSKYMALVRDTSKKGVVACLFLPCQSLTFQVFVCRDRQIMQALRSSVHGGKMTLDDSLEVINYCRSAKIDMGM